VTPTSGRQIPIARDDRRAHGRVHAASFPEISARILGGERVALVNLSARGVLLRAATRLLPARSVTLRFIARDAILVLNGSVVRSAVARLTTAGVLYETAVHLASENVLFLDLVNQPAASVSETPPADALIVTVPVPDGSMGDIRQLLATGATG